jgi:antirestriction protein ArdC
MPAFEAFNSAASYYSTAFHELGHWTGAKARLNREFGKRFGDKAYAAEELVAELTAAFLCAEFNVDGELRHAGYIANWIELLKEDARAFFAAASAAQKAADHMRQAVLAADEIADEVRLAA